MSEMEERLKAALAARADLVREEDLAPLPAPHGRPERGSSWHSPRHWLPLAAVAAIVVAIPLLVSLVMSDPDPAGPTGPPSGLPSSDAGPTLKSGAISGGVGDLDGDGRSRDEVELRTDASFAQLTGTILGKGQVIWEAPVDRLPVSLADVADVDGRGGEEVLLETGSGPKVLVVLTLVAAGDDFAVLSDDQIKSGKDPEGFRHHWWVDEDGLVSTVSVRPLTQDDVVYEVDAFRWEPRQGLAPVELGRFCVRADREARLHESCDELNVLPPEHGGL